MLDTLTTLRAEQAKDREDAERVDWLEGNFGETGLIHQPTPLLWRVDVGGITNDAWSLREAVDAARATLPETGT